MLWLITVYKGCVCVCVCVSTLLFGSLIDATCLHILPPVRVVLWVSGRVAAWIIELTMSRQTRSSMHDSRTGRNPEGSILHTNTQSIKHMNSEESMHHPLRRHKNIFCENHISCSTYHWVLCNLFEGVPAISTIIWKGKFKRISKASPSNGNVPGSHFKQSVILYVITIQTNS